MDDATYRRKADKLLRACSNNGNLGHCIGCDKFVVSETPKIPHTKGCPVEELLSAGPANLEGAHQAMCGCAWLTDATGAVADWMLTCHGRPCVAPEEVKEKRRG